MALILNWQNLNSFRRFPFTSDTKMSDVSNAVTLPDDFLIDYTAVHYGDDPVVLNILRTVEVAGDGPEGAAHDERLSPSPAPRAERSALDLINCHFTNISPTPASHAAWLQFSRRRPDQARRHRKAAGRQEPHTVGEPEKSCGEGAVRRTWPRCLSSHRHRTPSP